LDLGCGRGTVARLIAKEFPACRVVGVDIDEASIDAARAHPDTAHMERLSYVVGDVSKLGEWMGDDWLGSFDLVLFRCYP
jgi:ubiquinone/menaquinone biosynthesis C-methylase UbiE